MVPFVIYDRNGFMAAVNLIKEDLMAQAKSGDTVKVKYTGKLDDGTVFDSSIDRDPLEFTIGENMIIPGFEAAVIGMNIGETKTINIPPEEAYGPYFDEMVMEANREEFPADMKPEIGLKIQIHHEDGGSIIASITKIVEDIITLDANHPMAGKALNFDIELVGIC